MWLQLEMLHSFLGQWLLYGFFACVFIVSLGAIIVGKNQTRRLFLFQPIHIASVLLLIIQATLLKDREPMTTASLLDAVVFYLVFALLVNYYLFRLVSKSKK